MTMTRVSNWGMNENHLRIIARVFFEGNALLYNVDIKPNV